MGMPLAELESPPMLTLDTVRMAAVREAVPLSQTQAAKRAKMTASRWNDIESGRRSNVTIETLGEIAEALGCDPAELLKSSRKRK